MHELLNSFIQSALVIFAHTYTDAHSCIPLNLFLRSDQQQSYYSTSPGELNEIILKIISFLFLMQKLKLSHTKDDLALLL